MFKKKNKQITTENKTASQVDQDLIVHNMPQGGSLKSGAGVGSFSTSKGLSDEKDPHNFKMVGALIIGFGIILVGALIFFSYRYLIKPDAKPEVNSQVQTNVQENLQEEVIEEEVDELEATSTDDIIDIEEVEVVVGEGESPVADDENDDSMEQTEAVTITVIEDNDSDGLNNEEEAVLGTNSNEADSDADGYPDLAEIENGYNPAGGGTLSDNPNLIRHYSSVANYSLLYPKNWELSSTNNDYTVILSAPDNSLIQISVQANTKMQGILTWYAETVVPGAPDSDLIKSGTGWSGVMGEDGRNFYLTDEERTNIYVISYIPVLSSSIVYPNIFNLMINSLQIDL